MKATFLQERPKTLKLIHLHFQINTLWEVSMENSVIIKGNKYGIIAVLDSEMPFSELKVKIRDKFRESSKFFDNAEMGISFEGRELTNEEQREVLNIISEETDLRIVCVVDTDKEKEEIFKKT